MSLLNLVSLDEDDIELVTNAIHYWCQHNHIPIDSDRGSEATAAAVRLCLAGERSPKMLAEALSSEMRLAQFRNPRD